MPSNLDGRIMKFAQARTNFSSETDLIIPDFALDVNEDGEDFHFSEGDYVVFPEGMKCKWKINKEVRKHYRFG